MLGGFVAAPAIDKVIVVPATASVERGFVKLKTYEEPREAEQVVEEAVLVLIAIWQPELAAVVSKTTEVGKWAMI